MDRYNVFSLTLSVPPALSACLCHYCYCFCHQQNIKIVSTRIIFHNVQTTDFLRCDCKHTAPHHTMALSMQYWAISIIFHQIYLNIFYKFLFSSSQFHIRLVDLLFYAAFFPFHVSVTFSPCYFITVIPFGRLSDQAMQTLNLLLALLVSFAKFV